MIRIATAICMAGMLASCATAPTRFYVIRGPASYYGPAQSTSAQQWMQKRGIYDYVSYAPTTISFKYGSDEIRTMSYLDFDAFVQQRVVGYTIASAKRPDLQSSEGAIPGAVIYLDPDGRFAQWGGTPATGSIVTLGRWWIEDVPELEMAKARNLGVQPPPRVMCFDSAINAAQFGSPLPRCSPVHSQLLGVHGRQRGDTFNLMSGKAPGVMNADYPDKWPDGQIMFPEKAPHD